MRKRRRCSNTVIVCYRIGSVYFHVKRNLIWFADGKRRRSSDGRQNKHQRQGMAGRDRLCLDIMVLRHSGCVNLDSIHVAQLRWFRLVPCSTGVSRNTHPIYSATFGLYGEIFASNISSPLL